MRGIRFREYLSLVKFSHTVFALPFAVIGYFAGRQASGEPLDGWLPALVLGCMVFARSAAMAFNRWADRRIDQKNPRTREREIPAGIITPGAALTFVVLSCLGFILCTWFINRLCFYLSPLALLIILGYSYTKRFTALSHFVLGLGLSMAPTGAYLAVTGQFALLPLLYSGLVLFWVGGFDILYALQDRDFDRQEGLHSLPVLLGVKGSLILSALAHGAGVIFLVLAGISEPHRWIFWAGVAVFVVLMIYQHLIVRPGNLSRINQAFAVVNGFAGILLSLFYVADWAFKIVS